MAEISKIKVATGTYDVKDKTVREKVEKIEKSLIVSVKDFEAKGDGASDDTTAIQKAIDYIKTRGGELFFPQGNYKITSNLSLQGITQNVHFKGDGLNSTIDWYGANNGIMFDFTNVSKDELKTTFSFLKFQRVSDCSNLTFFRSDSGNDTFLINLTFTNNHFINIHKVLDIYRETDQIVFSDNYVLLYQTGIKTSNGICSNIHVLNNHFRGGGVGSYALEHGGGNNITFNGNTVQSGSYNIGAVKMSDVTCFNIQDLYLESPHSIFQGVGVHLTRVHSGYIKNIVSHGAIDEIINLVDCRSIDIGNLKHSVSGGYPKLFVRNTNSQQIRLTGYLDGWLTETRGMVSGSFDVMNTVTFQGEVFVRNNLLNALNYEFKNYDVYGIVDWPLIGSYRFILKNDTEGVFVMGYVLRNKTTKLVITHDDTGGQIQCSIFNDELRVQNGVSAVRTIKHIFERVM